MLSEVISQSNQHDRLAESFCKDQYKTLQEQVKRLKDQRKKNMKEADKIETELKKAYKTMDAAKDKFRKAYEEQEKADATYSKAENDGTVTKNEVKKLHMVATKKGQECEAAHGKYAEQLVKTNKFQMTYYHELLPKVLSELQALEQSRLEVFRDTVRGCVNIRSKHAKKLTSLLFLLVKVPSSQRIFMNFFIIIF